VPHDFAQSAYWYRKAAEQGDVLSQIPLGWLYFNGEGVPQDYAEAYFWYSLAAAVAASSKTPMADEAVIVERRDSAASHLTPAELSRVQERARKWFEDHPAKAQ